MATAQLKLETNTAANPMPGYGSERSLARFERELAMYKEEDTRLRCALARAEALLDNRGPAESAIADRVAKLTPRQHEIMDLVLAGHPSKNIAADLGISRRTVENHRAAIMRKTGSKSLPALGRFGLAASRPIAPARCGKDSDPILIYTMPAPSRPITHPIRGE